MCVHHVLTQYPVLNDNGHYICGCCVCRDILCTKKERRGYYRYRVEDDSTDTEDDSRHSFHEIYIMLLAISPR